MNTNKISTKIKFIGGLLMIIIVSVILATIYLNQRNVKDALIINIAGKQRMLTQKISKNVFYHYNTKSTNFSELDDAVIEFNYNLNSLKDGNELRGISKVPTDEIAEQLSKVTILWNGFYNNVESFKSLLINNENNKLIEDKIDSIYKTNLTLLNEVDKVVTLYTLYSEHKTQYIKYFQYGAGVILLLLIMYAMNALKKIEAHAKEFLNSSKELASSDGDTPLKPIKLEGESEILEATNTINCFITKLNSAMDYSAQAIEQSKNASAKLEEITDEFDKVLDEIQDKTISRQLNKSEDMVIESTEELINSTKKLQNLKNELDMLIMNCKIHS